MFAKKGCQSDAVRRMTLFANFNILAFMFILRKVFLTLKTALPRVQLILFIFEHQIFGEMTYIY